MNSKLLTKFILSAAAATSLFACAHKEGKETSNQTQGNMETIATSERIDDGTSNKGATAAGKSIASESFADRRTDANRFWFPERLDLSPLRQFGDESNPYGTNFDYIREFRKLDLKAVKADIAKVLTTSQDWWPADYGHYGPFMVRMAWHSAGTYRTLDGRGGAAGGQQRFEPLNSWPDNVSLDKARRLLWPVKAKYGKALSWADLMVLAGNVSLESMGFKTYGFAGGRQDAWEADLTYWGPEKKWLADDRRDKKTGQIRGPMAAVQMGLIYVNPEGPNGKPDPLLAAKDIREAFGKMGMNDEETAALIAGGHSFGKAHGAHDPSKCVGAEPARAGLEDQGFGWKNKCGTGMGKDTVTSGLEGAWTSTPTAFSIAYLANLYAFDWELFKSPAGAQQWRPKGGQAANTVPDAHVKDLKHAPIMFTTDLALKEDPTYRKITEAWLNDPKAFEQAFAKAWFKLTHRDMGPRALYVGSLVPKEELIWQDPIPAAKNVINAADVATLKNRIASSGLSNPELIRAAWASASSFRGTDKRGGANGGRIRLAPEKDWAVNNPEELAKVLKKMTEIQTAFNKGSARKVSIADLVVLGGVVGLEKAAKAGGLNVKVPFTPGRMDASQEQTDVASFAVLEPKADAFRNYFGPNNYFAPLDSMVERASSLNLSVPEMTVLIGGLRVLDANTGGSKVGVLTSKPGTLSNDFFVNLLDMGTKWQKSAKADGLYEGVDRKSNAPKWTASAVDLIFGSNSELRAVAEVYASGDGRAKFATDFVKAWDKVMMADRFDLKMKQARN